MGLITKEGEQPNHTFKLNLAWTAFTHLQGMMMYLLNSLMSKINRIIKNQHRLTTNQKAIVARISYMIPDEPLLLVSASKSEDSDEEEPLDVEAYD